MARVIWKGAISFGLVHVPVAVYPAARHTGIDFDWLDKRSMDPVGYKRINKRTGEAIESADIVKGIKQEDGDYVLLSDEQIKAAYPKTTQTIEIEAFVQAAQISFMLLETPYYLEPIGKGDKVYALLREAMLEASVIGIARVILNTKEHLAALIPSGAALVLNTIRWADEIRPADDLKLPQPGKTAAGLKATELQMAGQLIADMTADWDPSAYADNFTQAVQRLVDQKLADGDTRPVTALENVPEEAKRSNVIDLAELLSRSLNQRKAGDGEAEDKAGNKSTAGKVGSKTAGKKVTGPAAKRVPKTAAKPASQIPATKRA